MTTFRTLHTHHRSDTDLTSMGLELQTKHAARLSSVGSNGKTQMGRMGDEKPKQSTLKIQWTRSEKERKKERRPQEVHVSYVFHSLCQ